MTVSIRDLLTEAGLAAQDRMPIEEDYDEWVECFGEETVRITVEHIVEILDQMLEEDGELNESAIDYIRMQFGML